MLRKLAIRLIAAALAVSPMAASAQTSPIVVELYTSQGCSSCPPADAFLAELAKDPNVLPLAFHVDYWDRLGWKDTFGSKANTQRQYAYAKALGNRMVWTPQFIVDGEEATRGNFRSMVRDYVAARKKQKPLASVELAKSGSGYVATITPLASRVPSSQILVVSYTSRSDVAIKRGENAGRTVSYHNTVNAWEQVARWNGRGAIQVKVSNDFQPPFAVLVQADGPGDFLAAQVLN